MLQVVTESYPEWDLNPRPPNSVQTSYPTDLSVHEFNSHLEPALYSYSHFIFGWMSDLISAIVFISRHVYFNQSFIYTYVYIMKIVLKDNNKWN